MSIARTARRSYIEPVVIAEKSGHMRAEIERLVEEIKQSVGLLRRHL
jgi:hypothetical protein